MEMRDPTATLPDLTRTSDLEELDRWLRRQGITRAELALHKRRPPHLVTGRRIVAHWLRARGWSLMQIAELLGYADHSSVVNLLSRDPAR